MMSRGMWRTFSVAAVGCVLSLLSASAGVNALVGGVMERIVVDGRLDEPAWKAAEWTAPWSVLGRENANVNGLFETADDKFAKNASTAALLHDDENLYVAIRSPFPADVPPVVKGGVIWGDDHVEFFLQIDGDAYFQVAVNSAGKTSFIKFDGGNGLRRTWNPTHIEAKAVCGQASFDVEMRIPFSDLGPKRPSDGTLWRGNFARDGRSCGGLSTWAPVGMNFCSQQGFGSFVFGSRKSYFEQEARRIAAAVPTERRDAGFAAALAKFTSGAEHGEDAASWDSLGAAATELQSAAVRLLNGGKGILVRACDPWAEMGPYDPVPFEDKALEEIRLYAPKGARALAAFKISNLTGHAALYHLNVLSGARDAKQERAFRFRQVEYIELNGGRMVPDPIFDLPVGRVITVPPQTTAIVWVDADTAAFAPGVHKGLVRMVSAYREFPDVRFAYRLRVGKADVSTVKMPVWAYPLRDPDDIRRLGEYGFNVACLTPRHFAPEPGQDGRAAVDEIFKAFAANGVKESDVSFILYAQWPQWSTITLPTGKKAGFLEPGWEEEYGRRLREFVAWIGERHGVGYDRMAFYTNDEPSGDPDDRKETAWYAFRGAEFVRRVDSNIRLFTNPWKCEEKYMSRYIETFDILEPCLPRLMQAPESVRTALRDSGKTICSYSVLMKRNPPFVYRNMFWQHLALGYEGFATFYDLFDCSGDPFLSYDAKPKSSVIDDYQTCYRDAQSGQVAVSRRLESWSVGLMEFKLAKWCRARVAERKRAGADVSGFEKELAAVCAGFSAPGAKVDALAARLFALSEKLAQ